MCDIKSSCGMNINEKLNHVNRPLIEYITFHVPTVTCGGFHDHNKQDPVN